MKATTKAVKAVVATSPAALGLCAAIGKALGEYQKGANATQETIKGLCDQLRKLPKAQRATEADLSAKKNGAMYASIRSAVVAICGEKNADTLNNKMSAIRKYILGTDKVFDFHGNAARKAAKKTGAVTGATGKGKASDVVSTTKPGVVDLAGLPAIMQFLEGVNNNGWLSANRSTPALAMFVKMQEDFMHAARAAMTNPAVKSGDAKSNGINKVPTVVKSAK